MQRRLTRGNLRAVCGGERRQTRNTRPPPNRRWCRGGQQRPPTCGEEENPTRGHLLVGCGAKEAKARPSACGCGGEKRPTRGYLLIKCGAEESNKGHVHMAWRRSQHEATCWWGMEERIGQEEAHRSVIHLDY